MEYLLGGTRGPAGAGYPPVNVWASDESAVVTLEVPGFKAEEIQVSVKGRRLTIKGTRNDAGLPDEGTYNRRERMASEFSRQLQFPYRLDEGAIEARVENGVLEISLPRAVTEGPKSIEVRAG